MKSFNTHFWNGALVMMCFMSFVQDWMGKDKYIDFVRDHWIVMNPMWWAAALGMMIITEINQGKK